MKGIILAKEVIIKEMDSRTDMETFSYLRGRIEFFAMHIIDSKNAELEKMIKSKKVLELVLREKKK